MGAPYNACLEAFTSQSLCAKNGDILCGSGSSVPGVPAEGLPDCCAVNDLRKANGAAPLILEPTMQTAIRDANYKRVDLVVKDCSTDIPRATKTSTELYRIDEKSPALTLDTESRNLLPEGRSVEELTYGQRRAYAQLARQLSRWEGSVVTSCPGDGNSDLVVDEKDLDEYARFAAAPDGTGPGVSSWCDFNLNGRPTKRISESSTTIGVRVVARQTKPGEARGAFDTAASVGGGVSPTDRHSFRKRR